MACVVTEPCINCRYGECAQACPVHAFHQGPNFMVIDPTVCVNCTVCTLVCPLGAIKCDYELAEGEREYLDLNRRLSAIWPSVTMADPPLPDADQWALHGKKREHLNDASLMPGA